MKNEFELIGRITQKPELIKTKLENVSFALANVAISKRIKQDNGEFKEYTDFIKVSYFRKPAEFIANYINVGDLVLIKGHIKVKKDYDEVRRMNLYTNELIGDSIKILARSNKSKEKQDDEIQKEIDEYKESQSDFKQVGFKTSIKTDELEFDEFDLPF